MTENVIPLKKRERLRCIGAGRDGENKQSLAFYFDRQVTDDEMRFLHDVMKRAAQLMPEESSHD